MRRGSSRTVPWILALVAAGVFVWAWGAAFDRPIPIASGFETPRMSGRVSDPRLSELSGLVESRSQPGLFWTHNDSGNSPTLFAIRSTGELVAAFVVVGAENRDWEDIALGPAPIAAEGGDARRDWVYIADTGDNLSIRATGRLIAIPEPLLSLESTGATRPATILDFRYETGPIDVEAIVIDRVERAVYLFSKGARGSRIDRVPLDADARGERVARTIASSRSLRWVTAADLTDDRRTLVVRAGAEILVATAAGGALVLDSLAGSVDWRRVLAPPEAQGEAVAVSISAERIWTIGEGASPRIFVIERSEPSAR
jgi:hypothetical protein